MTSPAASGVRAPLLSVSVIARNEARRLPGFLEALAGLAEEIALVDTGSTDETVAVARAAGCTVHTFTWNDDFSAARNAALAYCTGAWILSLDADERIAPADHEAVRELLDGPRDRCYRFTTRNYTNQQTASGFVAAEPGDPHCAGFAGWFPSTKVRLFPNISGVRFEGTVHELAGPSLTRLGVPATDTPIPVHHYPLLHRSPAAQREKQHYYLALGKQKVVRDPADARARHELGDQYADLGELGPALRAYTEAVRLAPGNARWLQDLGSTLVLAGKLPQAVQALRLSAQLDASSAECWRNLGVAYAGQEAWPQAREAFEQSHALDPDHPETLRYLAIARQALGDSGGALELLERLLQRFPHHEEAAALYQNVMAQLGRAPEAAAWLAARRGE